ncbi:MAG: polyamine aminopropyltransferase [Anaerolineales bacterium]
MIWFTEELHPYYRKGIRVKKILADEQTPFQHIQILETEFFGKAMILDGIIQLTERDNMGYHEMLVHVPMLAAKNPKRVLIVGGGDGGSLRQALRYPAVEEVIVCELDQRVVDLSREHFRAAFGDPWSDPRAKLLVRDAFAFLEENPGQFDVIISDTTDPIGMAENLFSDRFYRLLARALAPNGAAATQCEQPFFDATLIKTIYQSAKALTQHPAYYYANIPTYPGGGIGFMYVSNTSWEEGLKTPYPPGANEYLNPEIHRAAFALPEFFRKDLYD